MWGEKSSASSSFADSRAALLQNRKAAKAQNLKPSSLVFSYLISILNQGKRYRLLDLGRSFAENVAFFSKYCNQQHYEDLAASLLDKDQLSTDSLEDLANLQPALAFDIILCWDIFAYYSDESLNILSIALKKCCHEDTKIIYFKPRQKLISSAPGYYTFKSINELKYQPNSSDYKINTFPCNSKLEKHFPYLLRHKSFLLRHGMEEVLAGVKS